MSNPRDKTDLNSLHQYLKKKILAKVNKTADHEPIQNPTSDTAQLFLLTQAISNYDQWKKIEKRYDDLQSQLIQSRTDLKVIVGRQVQSLLAIEDPLVIYIGEIYFNNIRLVQLEKKSNHFKMK